MSTPLDKLRLRRERPTDLDAGSTERVNGTKIKPFVVNLSNHERRSCVTPGETKINLVKH